MNNDKKYLSVTPNLVAYHGTPTPQVNLWPQDDGSGRQRWNLKHLFDDVYNILVYGGGPTGFKYLSCTPAGYVDLWKEDDGSGRQRWILKKVTSDTYNIMVHSGTNEGMLYLSSDHSGQVVLVPDDYNSGMQKWIIRIMGNKCNEFSLYVL